MIQTSTADSHVEPLVFVVMGSVRPSRVCPKIAAWVIGIAQTEALFACELVDLGDWPLPANDEPEIPARGVYAQEHTRAWSQKISSAAAIIFVTPQYNWGYPAPLKNAIDHLYSEWKDKPVAIVSYGGHGGDKCAAQLRQVLEAIKARTMETTPGIVLTNAMIHGAPIEPEIDFVAHVNSVRQVLKELSDVLAA